MIARAPSIRCLDCHSCRWQSEPSLRNLTLLRTHNTPSAVNFVTPRKLYPSTAPSAVNSQNAMLHETHSICPVDESQPMTAPRHLLSTGFIQFSEALPEVLSLESRHFQLLSQLAPRCTTQLQTERLTSCRNPIHKSFSVYPTSLSHTYCKTHTPLPSLYSSRLRHERFKGWTIPYEMNYPLRDEFRPLMNDIPQVNHIEQLQYSTYPYIQRWFKLWN